MKRRLIYGLLVCLFVCASGMVGYGQEYYLHNLFANRVGAFEKKSASDYVFELDGTVHFYNGFYVANGADNNPHYIDLVGITNLNTVTLLIGKMEAVVLGKHTLQVKQIQLDI